MNLKKLAEQLGLSMSTVSRALRDSHEISKATKLRVRTLADQLGFQPNPHASSLRRSKSRTIAVVIPEIENNFFSQIINGVELVAQEKGYHVLIYLTHEDFQQEKEILQLLRNGRVDGLMISISNSTTDFEHLANCSEAQLPFVLFDRVCEDIDVPKIITDDIDVSFKATEHLIKKGCKKIAFLSMSHNLSISKRRGQGYMDAIKKYKLDWNKVIELSPKDAENRLLIKKLIKEEAPDGIFAAVEKFAINTYEVCHELEIHIPGMIKLISFSNLTAAALFHPPLSTVVQPAFDIGREAAAILFKIIDNKHLLPQEKYMIIPSHIVARKSSSKGLV